MPFLIWLETVLSSSNKCQLPIFPHQRFFFFPQIFFFFLNMSIFGIRLAGIMANVGGNKPVMEVTEEAVI